MTIEHFSQKYEEMVSAERARQALEAQFEIDMLEGEFIEDEAQAVDSGRLIELPDVFGNFRLIGALRRNEESRSLRPRMMNLLEEVGMEWSNRLKIRDLDPNLYYLSVSSLFRSKDWQKKWIETGKALLPRSPHQTGYCIDFDPHGYYYGDQFTAISISNAQYNPSITAELLRVLKTFHKRGSLHLIEEKKYQLIDTDIVESTYCWHICYRFNL